MKNKPLFILIITVAVVGAVAFAMNMKTGPPQETAPRANNEPAPRAENETTYNLMGIEMTREEAIEHCQDMPGMAECRQFGIEAPEGDLMSDDMDMDDMSKETDAGMADDMPGEVSEEMCQQMPEMAGCEAFVTETEG